MKKIYILDTNILLHDANSLLKFDDNDVVIPLIVIEELDNQKRRHDEVGRNARKVANLIDDLREKGKIYEGVSLPNGGNLRVELNHQRLEKLPPGFSAEKNDNRILAVALALQEENPSDKVIVVSKDTTVRIKGDVIGLATEDYKTDKVDINELYPGTAELEVEPDIINSFYRDEFLPLPKGTYYANQFFALNDKFGSGQSALARYSMERNGLVPLKFANNEAWSIKAKNREQRYAMELLFDDNIKLITLVGQAGTGKTLLAVAAGLQKVIEEEAFKKLLVTRPVIPLGNDIGFLPGEKDEKLRPWMSPIYDNIEYIMNGSKDTSKKDKMGRGSNNVESMIHYFKEKGQMELEALTYIRGRTIPWQYIIVDEAQNLTPHEIKTMLTRVGEGTKIILTGDPYQIDHPYLDSSSNGLTYVVEKFKHEKIAGHVTLTKGERSELAKLAADLI